MENPNFLKQKYWNREPFREASEKAAEKSENLKSKKEEDKIDAYIERIKNIIDKKPELFRNISLYSKFVIKPENITDDYIKNVVLGNFSEMKGYDRDKINIPEIKEQILKMFEAETGNRFEEYEVPQSEKEQVTEQTIQDQKASLDRWYEYLTGPESQNYPDEFRYWTFAEMLKLGAQDRGRKTFNKRDKDTVASFPSLNQQALARILDEINRKYQDKPSSINLDDEKNQKEFKKRLNGENFAKLYGWALDYVNSLKLPTERLPITEGEWRKYAKGSDPKKIVDSILEFNTGWCIDGEGTAKGYLGHSDIYIYYSEDENGESSIPRAAIINNGSKVSEVRGIIQNEKVKQHLDDYIAPVVEEKLNNLPGGEEWQDSMKDMKKLAEIHFKYLQKEDLGKDDLVFLYEVDKPIQDTGYGRDPRINEILKNRDIKEDLSFALDISKDQISTTKEEALRGSIIYHFGDLDLRDLQSAKDLNLPETINGYLNLSGLQSAKGLKLPETINGDLDLYRLQRAEGLNLPKTINGNLYLRRLQRAEGLKFPKTINGYLNLDSLQRAEGLNLPETINGGLFLRSLQSAKGLKLPETFKGGLNLRSLKSAEGLKLPETFNGGLFLRSLQSAKGLKLPKTINGYLYLSSLQLTEGLKLPETINGNLDLNSLESAVGLNLPETINGDLNLSGLRSAKGLKLPKTIKGSLNLNSLPEDERDKLRQEYPDINII